MWREGLLFKLAKMGTGKYMYNIIKNMLTKTEIALRVDQKHSEYFDIQRGVKQGDSLSPTLFNMFINDLNLNFISQNCDPPKLIDSYIGSLSFADDLLIMSESREGLQNSVNNLTSFCDNWQLSFKC